MVAQGARRLDVRARRVGTGLDAMAQADAAWRREHNWCNPPWGLLPSLAAKLRSSGAAATVVAPTWRSAPWYGELLRLCSEGALWRSYDAATRTEALRVVGRDPPTRGRAVNGSTRDEAPRIAAGRVLDAATGVARIVGAHVQVDIALVPA